MNYGFADEMQDWTREAFEVFKEVVNLPPAQIFCAGTPKEKGSFFEELWLASDMKEWNGREWIPTNPNADGRISGYHITQEFSPFVSKEELEDKRRTMPPRMFANEVLARFFAAGGIRPVPTENLLSLLIRSPFPAQGMEKSLGVDWGNETRWVLVGRPSSGAEGDGGKIHVIDSGVFDDVDTTQHVEKLKMIIAREAPRWVICDAGYGKTKNQMLMRAFPPKIRPTLGRQWTAQELREAKAWHTTISKTMKAKTIQACL